MQSNYTGHIGRAEWRWLLPIIALLVIIAFLPFLGVALRRADNPDWYFMGALHQHVDTAAHLSRMVQGMDGEGLVHFQHTPEPHKSALLYPLYIVLGYLTAITQTSNVMIFHVARIFAAFFMYPALYHLGASIWTKVRSRRIFFIVLSCASGLGWLLAPIMPDTLSPDLTIAAGYPFLSTVINVHYPLTITCLALLASELIRVLRPGMTEDPAATNGGFVLVTTGILLTFLYIETVLPITLGFIGCILMSTLLRRKLDGREWRWLLWLIIPILPILAYFLITLNANPAVFAWLEQRSPETPSPILILAALGFPLLIAIPGLWRAIRRFEADGDRFMLMWLLAMLICVFLPLPIKQYFLAGVMIPVAYFVTRAVEDFWFQYIPRRRRAFVYILTVPVLAFSNLYALFIPVATALVTDTPNNAMLLEQEYVLAFNWLESRTTSDDVILAAPSIGTWIPYWTGARSYYGHPSETVDADKRRSLSIQWYRADTPAAPVCEQFDDIQDGLEGRFTVHYVLLGPREREIGAAACIENLALMRRFGQVSVYATRFQTFFREQE
ncbi:MAG: hypothetical protein ACPG7F_03340 [Aggregatilineales bacterium]